MAVTPTDRESPFELEELFLSITDAKGIIRASNDVFVRVSRYPEERMIGKAHNLIRHPDMPRSVFRLVWDNLHAGRAAAGYVKNMAADGAYYWVMATLIPAGDGYLSVRLKPTSPAFALVQEVYARTLAHEHELARAGMRPRDVAVEAIPFLLEQVQQAGFADYDAFARHVLPLEIRAREEALAASGYRPPACTGRLSHPLNDASLSLDELFARVEVFADAASTLSESTGFIRRLAGSVDRNALNGLIAARRLTAGGATLAVVADRMSRCAGSIAEAVAAFTDDVDPAMSALHDLEYRIALLKAQVDMSIVSALELETVEHEPPVRARREMSLSVLLESLTGHIDELGDALNDLGGHLRALERGTERIGSALNMLGALHMAGRIEARHVHGAGAFTVLFDRVREQLAQADVHMSAVTDAVTKAMGTRSDTSALRAACASARTELEATPVAA